MIILPMAIYHMLSRETIRCILLKCRRCLGRIGGAHMRKEKMKKEQAGEYEDEGYWLGD